MAVRGRRIAEIVTGLSAVLAVWSCALLYSEWQVALSATMLRREATIIADGGIPVVGDSEGASRVPARALLIDGLRLSRLAAVTADRRARYGLLEKSKLALANAERARPDWGEVVIGQAYLSSLRRGDAAPDTLRLVAESYRKTSILKGAAPWRVMIGFGHWAALDARTQRAAINEAVWLSQQSYRDEQAVFAMARRSLAYVRFFLRWREVRLHRAER